MTEYPGVQDVHDLHIWTVTNGVNSLSAHIKVVEGGDHATILKGLTDLISREYGLDHVTLQLEPHTFDHQGGIVHS